MMKTKSDQNGRKKKRFCKNKGLNFKWTHVIFNFDPGIHSLSISSSFSSIVRVGSSFFTVRPL